MKKSELEKAAKSYLIKTYASDCCEEDPWMLVGERLGCATDCEKAAFEAGARWALEYALTHVKYGSAHPTAELLFASQFLEIEEDEKESVDEK